MSQDEKNIVVNIKIFIVVVTVLITILGWITNRTLSSIDDNLRELRTELKQQNQRLFDHESRIKILEEKTK